MIIEKSPSSTPTAAALKPLANSVEDVSATPRSALAADKIHSTGKMDNNGALLGVSGAKFVETKPAEILDEKGRPIIKHDANGHPVTKEAIGSPQLQGSKNGAGSSYEAMSKKLEEQRQGEIAAANHRAAELSKSRIVDEIRRGSTDPYLHQQLAELNRDVFNLPASHTGY